MHGVPPQSSFSQLAQSHRQMSTDPRCTKHTTKNNDQNTLLVHLSTLRTQLPMHPPLPLPLHTSAEKTQMAPPAPLTATAVADHMHSPSPQCQLMAILNSYSQLGALSHHQP